jgi:hypothetical protein
VANSYQPFRQPPPAGATRSGLDSCLHSGHDIGERLKGAEQGTDGLVMGDQCGPGLLNAAFGDFPLAAGGVETGTEAVPVLF